jgi:serine/threonine protein kinase
MGICPMKKKPAVELKIAPLIQQPVKRDINRKYHLKSNQVLGMGQFGKVILATNAHDKKQKVAVKALSKSKLGEKVDKLKKEVLFLNKLDSPYVVKYHEYFEDRDNFYLVMEYCPGGELFREIAMKLEMSQRYKEKDAAVIMQKLLKALAHIHSKGIAHRDIKPENIIWSREKNGGESHFKLIDFGLAHKFVKQS